MVNVESGGEGVGPGNPGESEPVEPGVESANVGNGAEISDLTQQEAGHELAETQESGEISPEAELENEYDQGLKLNERINKLKEQTDKDRAEIQKVRNELGSERKDIPADATIQELIDKQEELAKRMDALEAKALGADIILLIAACLSPEEILVFAKLAKSLGLSTLLEVHNQEELEQSLNTYLDVVGVNNRNLKDFTVSIETSLSLAETIPSEFLKISESAISNPETIKLLKSVGFNGFLIGENFMKTENPGKAMEAFVKSW